MIKNFIITSVRFLLRSKSITIISLLGLTFAISFSLIIALYVKKEFSVDRTFKNRDHTVRIEFISPDGKKNAVMPSALGPDLKEELPEIKDFLRIQFWNDIVLKKDNENFVKFPRICLADSSFFDIFDQIWVYGSPKNALNKPLSIVLTDEFAKKIFGDENPVGKFLTNSSGTALFPITGVIKKRHDSHLSYDALLSMVTLSLNSNDILHTYSTQQWLTYFRLTKGTITKNLEEKIYKKLHELYPSLKNGEQKSDVKVLLTSLKDIYFSVSHDLGTLHGNYQLTKVLIAIALLIIIIACINFVNLSTARATKRAREVGLRKLVGSKRNSLIIRFLIESFTICLASTILGLIVAEIALPYFNNLVGKNLSITYFDNYFTIPVLVGIIIITGLFNGLYPAYYISSFKAIEVIKGEVTKGRKTLGFRRGLILFQFLISVILINGSILIHKQLKYVDRKDLGFNKERILTLNMPGAVKQNMRIIREKLLQNPEIVSVSFSYTIPGSHLNYEGFIINNKEVSPQVFSIDPDYIKTYGIEVIKGRGFDAGIGSDSVSNCLINETFAKEIGIENILDESFLHPKWYITMFPVKNIRIIGVVKDFHFKSLRTPIEPLMLAWNKSWLNYINIKISEGNIPQAMEKVKAVLNEFVPGRPIDYLFIDESFDRMYKADEKLSKILIYFTLLGVLISIMGLVGITVFMTEQRTKEVAILKICGAAVSSIIQKLGREYILIVIIANLMGWPIILWLGKKWLNEFAYKTDIGVDIFIVGAITSTVIALITVFIITYRASTANPVDSLRYE